MKKSYQSLSDIQATCVVCEARCDARNAQAWAHIHARTTGHVVYVSPIFKVTSAQGFMFSAPQPARTAAKSRGGESVIHLKKQVSRASRWKNPVWRGWAKGLGVGSVQLLCLAGSKLPGVTSRPTVFAEGAA